MWSTVFIMLNYFVPNLNKIYCLANQRQNRACRIYVNSHTLCYVIHCNAVNDIEVVFTFVLVSHNKIHVTD